MVAGVIISRRTLHGTACTSRTWCFLGSCTLPPEGEGEGEGEGKGEGEGEGVRVRARVRA